MGALVYGIFILLCAAVFLLLITINSHFLITVPARGGNLTEGVIGAPHYINPILATTDTDTRLVALVYGSFSDIEQGYTVSPDGQTYTVTLKPHLVFSDNKPLTSDDVAFTIEKMQDNTISATSGYWQNITVATPDTNTIVFTLPAADTTFLSRLNFGILPKHMWQNIDDSAFETAKQNLAPVGAGPFKVSRILYQNGIPSTVVLRRNTHFVGGKALLNTITITSFANQSAILAAVDAGSIDFTYGLAPQTIATVPLNTDFNVQPVPTTETVSIYRSSADTSLANSTTAMMVNQIIDKNAIIATVQDGYGTPQGVLTNASVNSTIKKASSVSFSLAVPNDPPLLLTAQTLAQQLQQRGMTVAVKAYDPGTFQNNVTNGTFTLFLAGNNDVDIPPQYAAVIPLYTTSQPYVFNAHTHTVIPDTIDSPETEYSTVTQWYTNTDKLWKLKDLK